MLQISVLLKTNFLHHLLFWIIYVIHFPCGDRDDQEKMVVFHNTKLREFLGHRDNNMVDKSLLLTIAIYSRKHLL